MPKPKMSESNVHKPSPQQAPIEYREARGQ
jgi:hypothetical protein